MHGKDPPLWKTITSDTLERLVVVSGEVPPPIRIDDYNTWDITDINIRQLYQMGRSATCMTITHGTLEQ